MDELKFQARLVKEAKKRKGWAIKLANRHQAGVPDLFIKLFTLPAVMIECKKDKLNMTPLQRETLKRMLVANLNCGWVLYKKSNRVFNVHVGADPFATEPLPTNCNFVPVSGLEWDIGEIVKEIVYWSNIEMDKLG